MKILHCLILVLCLLKHSEQRSTVEDDSYVAAVVEYQFQSDVQSNLREYVKFIQEAADQNADVVVFPEMTLTRGSRAVPVPIHSTLKTYPVPALQPELYDEILVSISTAARERQVYVVVNIQEQMDCANTTDEYCPEQKTYYFNTNVVFDRNGSVIDRYRKIHLFGEFTRSPALQPDLGVFSTDFGVTFGHYICFDLMFQVPAVQIVQKHNITDVIFTTMWFSEMPFLTAVQIQESYAYAMNVNFLASGANNVRVGSAGSGIYSGRAGALVSTMPGVPTTRLLVSKVPKIPGQVNFPHPGPIYDNPSDHDSLVLIKDPSLPSHISRELVQGSQEFTLVDKDVTCKFRVNLNYRNGDLSHRYRAFVYDGSNTYVREQLGVANCLVVACKDGNVKNCPYRFTDKDTNIEELEIGMSTHRLQYNSSLNCDNVFYYPSSIRNNKFPLSPKNFTYSQNGSKSPQNGPLRIDYKLIAPQDELIGFGIWGRIYNKDVDHNKPVTEVDIQSYYDVENAIFGP